MKLNEFISNEQYEAMYDASLKNPAQFWGDEAKHHVVWHTHWQSVFAGDFSQGNVKWFQGATLNVTETCLDRHLPHLADKPALLWQGDHPDEAKTITYLELSHRVKRFANALKIKGIQPGDKVCIYLPMIPEAVIAMLACARIGAVHSVVFAGFSAESLKTRILDSGAKMVITADEGVRGGKLISLKNQVDVACEDIPAIQSVIVVKRTGRSIQWVDQRDFWYHDVVSNVDAECPPYIAPSDHPLFILYTSGSTGKPKGVLHTAGGYLVYAATTFKYVFNHQPQDIYWCTADVGWITGHTYLVYGPLSQGATILLFEGVPHYPTYSRYWEIIEKYRVTIFYTAPTAIRALRREGDEWINNHDLSSLRLLGTVGEPINPDVWQWYYEMIGHDNCPIVDTWWQTETGGIMITPLPGMSPLKPGSAARPFFGVKPAIVDDEGKAVPVNTIGRLVIQAPWPGMMSTIYGDPERFYTAYFKEVPGCYLTGDDAKCDKTGYYWILGRNDDVIKVSGHRIGTGELENAFLTHLDVAEAAVVAVPDVIKGQLIYAFITLKENVKGDAALAHLLKEVIRKEIGSIAVPAFIQWADQLPKTRSGKIMRRLLRKIAAGDESQLGDTSTLSDPQVIDALISGHRAMKTIEKEK